MNELIVSTAYLPPIAFFVSTIETKRITVEQHENYIKQTYRNRCHILSANGILPLSIPVIKTDGNHTKLINIQISNINNWQLNHWRAIESAYNKSPFFLYYRDELETFYLRKFNNLLEFNSELLSFLLRKIGLKIEIIFSDDFLSIQNEENDLRFKFSPKKEEVIQFPHYYQVFEEKFGFIPNLSIIDLLFNEGPETLNYLESVK
jgi:hypothetical protein